MTLTFRRALSASLLTLLPFSLPLIAQAQGSRIKLSEKRAADVDADHEKQRSEWFLRGRIVSGKSTAALRKRAYQTKMQARAALSSAPHAAQSDAQTPSPAGGWVPLGPVPLASDATGDGFQNYNQVSGRATAIAIDPADPSGNTVYIGGAQGGVWKSVNAAASPASTVGWTAISDDQATLSIGSIAIQPGNSNPANSVILVGTGEADNSADSYFGLGILRSSNAGNSWALISTANGGTLSFSGLGTARMAFSTANPNTVVAAMTATTEGLTDGALTDNTLRGLYTSTDAGQTWTYDALFSGASEATSASSVVYNATTGLFFAALRYHGFYSSPDGLTWTRLANQPGASGVLGAAACPQNYSPNCPIYRGEISVVPGRNEMYTWFLSLDSNNNPVDQGIWRSTTGGASWAEINDSGIINCGDFDGCGVEQGYYNLELLAVPNGSAATDLYAGAINLFKCSISSANPNCSAMPFMDLTHVYGCNPLAAPAHVHPDQHALVDMIPTAGSDSGADLMYFADDGGIYRALNGYTGLGTGSCSGTNQFDDLNQNLGSMTQFVSFSQSASDANTLLGGTQDNGSPATATATTSSSWGNVLSGDGGYNAIDPDTGNWFASNPDTGSGTLNIQECSSGINCNDSLFNSIVSSTNLGGDDGAFYFPYTLDPQSTTTLLVGTCRVWSGPRSGGTFTLLSLNFDTLGTGTCAGTEVNTIRSLAAGGAVNALGSQVVYVTTDGPGPNGLTAPIGGNVWVTTNATAVSGTTSTFADVTLNGPGGASINPDQFPISSVAVDTSDATGDTAYVTVMGFTGGPGHVWQTTNAGASWIDFTGTAANALPDSPVNAVVVDPVAHMVYVGTDVGVFGSSTLAAAWTEVGAIAGPSETGFLPNVAVTALAIFTGGSEKLLRASTYGRGVWEFNLLVSPDFQIAVSNTPLTVVLGSPATLNGTITALNGYNNSVELSCTPNPSTPPSPCTPSPVSLTPTSVGSAFIVTPGTSAIGSYNFNVQGAGSDPNNIIHAAAVTLNVVNIVLAAPLPTVTEPRGATSTPVNFQVTAQGPFNGSATFGCIFPAQLPGATCSFTPSATVNLTSGSQLNMTVAVTVPASTPIDLYPVTLQASIPQGTVSFTPPFTLNVVPNPDFVLGLVGAFPNVKAGSTGMTGAISVTSQDGFAGVVALSCVSTFGPASCRIAPSSIGPPYSSPIILTINGTSFSAGSYQVAVQGTSGALTHSLTVPFNVGDYAIAGPSTLLSDPGSTATLNLTFTSEGSYSGQVGFSCDSSGLPQSTCVLNPPSSIFIGSGAVVPVTANITVPANATAGNYNIKISAQDAGGEPTHSFAATLTVQDFALGTVTPATQSVGSGGQPASYTVTIKPVGASFAGAVSLACANAPANSTCSFAPDPVTPGNASTAVTMTIATTAATPQGNYNVAVTGTSGSLSHAATAALTIANTLQVAVSPNTVDGIDAGSQQSAKITVTPNYAGLITASCDASALSATQCTLTPSSPIAVSGKPVVLNASINIPNSAAPGTYNINFTVKESGGASSATGVLKLTIVQDFSITPLTPSTQTISVGQTASYNFSVLPVGAAFPGAVNLSCGSTSICSFTPNPATPGTGAVAVVLTINTAASSATLPSLGPAGTGILFALWITLPALVLLGRRMRLNCARQTAPFYPLLALFLLGLSLVSCGGGSNGGSGPGGPVGNAKPGTYIIIVTGTSGALSHQAPAVTLIVN